MSAILEDWVEPFMWMFLGCVHKTHDRIIDGHLVIRKWELQVFLAALIRTGVVGEPRAQDRLPSYFCKCLIQDSRALLLALNHIAHDLFPTSFEFLYVFLLVLDQLRK